MALPAAASVVTSGLAAYPTVFYDRKATDTLFNNLFLYNALDQKKMPDMSGVAMQIFNYTAFAANTTAATEGTPAAGQTLTQNTATINLSQYVDSITYSDKAVLTAISDIVTEGSEQLGYRGALSVDTVIREAVDVNANTTTAARIDKNDGTYLTAAVIRQAAMSIRSANGKPKDNGLFYGISHSLTIFDLTNDSSAAGWVDLMKYTDGNAGKLQEGIRANRVGVVGGVEIFESNNVKSYASWQSSSHTAYATYVFGKGAFWCSSLGTTQLGQKNFSVRTVRYTAPVAADAASQIVAGSSYNFYFGLVAPPDGTARYRRIRTESSLS
jgi:N4-gp56 family major capsid protein